MAFIGVLFLSCLRILMVFILVLEPNRVLGSRNNFGGNSEAGMCASTVAAHGYKCQEFEVYIYF